MIRAFVYKMEELEYQTISRYFEEGILSKQIQMKEKSSKFKTAIEKFISRGGMLYHYKKKEDHIRVIRKHEI